MALWVLRRVGFCVGQNQMCHLCVGIFLSLYVSLICSLSLSFRVTANSFGLCVRAGFRAQNFHLLLKFNRNTELHVCKSARLTKNQCYSQWFSLFLVCRYVLVLAVSFNFRVICKVVVTKLVKFFFCT